jgi:hypothetical protein
MFHHEVIFFIIPSDVTALISPLYGTFALNRFRISLNETLPCGVAGFVASCGDESRPRKRK